ncbi:hypothetical protein E4Z66_08555 [Aliishimia ponticola]|uniref:H-type lectin domain-containing protein n=1 Tax=Aliishimia ponticola TaxID=2499833 RepID=A0A4S4NC86_9RHOB|nr:H-type lectin domain-containing protein [Aliishimia ponticola]THH36979.1 hypothetical protein E4Z66_08555 [Aliishimia ponticola]
MKRLRNHLIGIDQGNAVLFSDFETDGEMWTGNGQRERLLRINFSEPFRAAPTVHLTLSMWDIDNAAVIRGDLQAEAITNEGFDMVFRTWGDTRVARLRAGWLAIGELRQADDWDLY